MRPVALDDFEAQPFRFRAIGRLRAEPLAVFAELGEMAPWFPLMRSCVWTSAPGGVGAERDVDVIALGRFRERMLAWDPGSRVAFTMTATTTLLMARMAEDWRLSGESTHTRLEWVVVGTPKRLGGVLAPALRVVLSLVFRRACRNLQQRASPAATE